MLKCVLITIFYKGIFLIINKIFVFNNQKIIQNISKLFEEDFLWMIINSRKKERQP